jgi:hypothetical protein
MAVKRAKGRSRLTPVRRSNSHDSGYSLQSLLDLPCALAFDEYIARLLELRADELQSSDAGYGDGCACVQAQRVVRRAGRLSKEPWW